MPRSRMPAHRCRSRTTTPARSRSTMRPPRTRTPPRRIRTPAAARRITTYSRRSCGTAGNGQRKGAEMPKDKQGAELTQGDVVSVQCEVMWVFPQEDGYNINLRTVDPGPNGEPIHFAIHAAQS